MSIVAIIINQHEVFAATEADYLSFEALMHCQQRCNKDRLQSIELGTRSIATFLLSRQHLPTSRDHFHLHAAFLYRFNLYYWLHVLSQHDSIDIVTTFIIANCHMVKVSALIECCLGFDATRFHGEYF
jgi:hypothetical protein